MASTLRLQIVTPKGTAYSDDVEMVIVPGVEGQFGVLPHHLRLMTQMIPGELLVRKKGKDSYVAVGGGLVEVTGKRVLIATDMAIAAGRDAPVGGCYLVKRHPDNIGPSR